jgi:hypothetical protein
MNVFAAADLSRRRRAIGLTFTTTVLAWSGCSANFSKTGRQAVAAPRR